MHLELLSRSNPALFFSQFPLDNQYILMYNQIITKERRHGMSRKQKKSGNKSEKIATAGLVTAILSLITAILSLIKELID